MNKTQIAIACSQSRMVEEKELEAIGKEIAKIFMMKKDKEHKDRYQMTWGNKTAIGLVYTLLRIAEDIMNQKEIKS